MHRSDGVTLGVTLGSVGPLDVLGIGGPGAGVREVDGGSGAGGAGEEQATKPPHTRIFIVSTIRIALLEPTPPVRR